MRDGYRIQCNPFSEEVFRICYWDSVVAVGYLSSFGSGSTAILVLALDLFCYLEIVALFFVALFHSSLPGHLLPCPHSVSLHFRVCRFEVRRKSFRKGIVPWDPSFAPFRRSHLTFCSPDGEFHPSCRCRSYPYRDCCCFEWHNIVEAGAATVLKASLDMDSVRYEELHGRISLSRAGRVSGHGGRGGID